MATWTTTEATVTWTAVDDPSVSWVVNVNPTVTGGGGAVDSVNGQTGVVVLDADDVGAATEADIATAIANGAVVLAVSTADVPAEEYGGVFDGDTLTIAAAAGSPAGTWLIRNQTVGTNNDLWTQGGTGPTGGTGTFTRQDPGLAFTRIGTLIVSQNTLTASLAAGSDPQVFRVTAANEVTELVVTTEQVQALIDASVQDALTAAAYATAEPEAWFAFDPAGQTTDQWETSDIPELVDGPDMRALIYFTRDAGDQFSEIWTRFFDGGAAEDSPELAIYCPTATGSPRLYLESVRGGETADESDFNVPLDVEGIWCWVRGYIDLDTNQAVAQIGVRWGGDTTTADGRQWRTLATETRPAGIEFNESASWMLGQHFESRIARGELYDGVDGTLVAAPDATDWTTGLSFTDSEGNEWTTTTGVVERSLDARVETLETATATVDVVSNVATSRILGRTTAGTGNSEELTAAQTRTLLAQPNVLLHSETLASDAASKSYDVTGWNKIRVEFMGRSTRNGTIDNLLLTLDGNTGNVYSTNTAALTSALTIGEVAGINTNTDRMGLVEAEIGLLSGYLKAGFSRSTNLASTATVGAAVVHRGLFSTITAAVTSVELKMGLSNIAAGSRIRIIGLEAA